MNTMNFIGREQELNTLRGKAFEEKSAITAIYGRRRIGKTTLIEYAFRNQSLLKFEGIEDQSEQLQREHFANTLAMYSGKPEHKLLDTSDWTKLLIALSNFVASTPYVILFDEYQWLSADKKNLTSYLKYCWDNYFLQYNKVHLIICGSVSTFIVKKVINSKALYGRIDTFIELKPLSLRQSVVDYFNNKTNNRQYLDYYLAVGGVPKYLELYDKGISLEQNLKKLCFHSHGYLFSELNRLFVSHFGKNKVYRDIIAVLAKHHHCTQSDIKTKTSLSSGGRLSTYLEELELAGFIEAYPSLNNINSRYMLRYRIKDAYLRFYFRFIEKNSVRIKSSDKPLDFSNIIKEKQYEIWRGLAFEQSCRDNHYLIAKILGFSGVGYLSGSWFKKADQKTGAQIDLLFIRDDRIITLCEVKYQRNITSSLTKNIEQKVERLMNEVKADGIQRVLLTAYDPPANLLSYGQVDQVINLDRLLYE